jgi:hypothetical protein
VVGGERERETEERNARWSEELLHHDVHAAEHLGQEKVVAGFVHDFFTFVEACGSWYSEAFGWLAVGCCAEAGRGVELSGGA